MRGRGTPCSRSARSPGNAVPPRPGVAAVPSAGLAAALRAGQMGAPAGRFPPARPGRRILKAGWEAPPRASTPWWSLPRKGHEFRALKAGRESPYRVSAARRSPSGKLQTGALKLAPSGAKSGSLQRSGCSFRPGRRRLRASRWCLEVTGRAAAILIFSALGHLFFAPRKRGVISLSAPCRSRGMIFDSRICLLEASERFRPCLPVLSREGAVPVRGSGSRRRFASRVVSGARSRGVCRMGLRLGPA